MEHKISDITQIEKGHIKTKNAHEEIIKCEHKYRTCMKFWTKQYPMLKDVNDIFWECISKL